MSGDRHAWLRRAETVAKAMEAENTSDCAGGTKTTSLLDIQRKAQRDSGADKRCCYCNRDLADVVASGEHERGVFCVDCGPTGR